jgi:hypothetical protein
MNVVGNNNGGKYVDNDISVQCLINSTAGKVKDVHIKNSSFTLSVCVYPCEWYA